MILAGFSVTNRFDAFFNGGGGFGDFAGANARLSGGFDFKSKIFDFDAIVFKGGRNKIVITIAKLFDIEGVFDADFNMAIFGGKKRGVLEPGGKIGRGDLLFDFSKRVFPNVIHFGVDLLYCYLL